MARARPSGLVAAFAYFVTALFAYILTYALAKPQLYETQSAVNQQSVTVDAPFEGGDFALVHMGEFSSETDALICCARYQNRGAAGFLFVRDDKYYAVGNAYISADAAADACERVRAQGINAGVIDISSDGVTLRLTADDRGVGAVENAYFALCALESELNEISEKLDSGELNASAARTRAVIAAHEFSTPVAELLLEAGDDSDECINALSALCETALARAKALSVGKLNAMYLSANVKHAYIDILTRRLGFLDEC